MLTGRIQCSVVCTLLVTCLAAGCSSPAQKLAASSGTAAYPTTRAVMTPSPTLTMNPEEQADAAAALAAYRQAWADMAAVEDEGNYQDPRLADHVTGHLLLTVSEALYASEQAGIASRGAPVLSPHVASVDVRATPPTVTIDDCIDARPFVQYYAATGKIYGTVATSDIADTATMTLTNGTWMMTANDEKYGTPCTP